MLFLKIYILDTRQSFWSFTILCNNSHTKKKTIQIIKSWNKKTNKHIRDTTKHKRKSKASYNSKSIEKLHRKILRTEFSDNSWDCINCLLQQQQILWQGLFKYYSIQQSTLLSVLTCTFQIYMVAIIKPVKFHNFYLGRQSDIGMCESFPLWKQLC